MRKTGPTNHDFPPLLVRYLGIFAGQDLAADQVTVVGVHLAVQQLAVEVPVAVVLVAVVDYSVAGTPASYICSVWKNNFVDSKAFEAGCSFRHFVTCIQCLVDFYK